MQTEISRIRQNNAPRGRACHEFRHEREFTFQELQIQVTLSRKVEPEPSRWTIDCLELVR